MVAEASIPDEIFIRKAELTNLDFVKWTWLTKNPESEME